MYSNEKKQEIVDYGIKAVEEGLVVGTAGNISIYDRKQEVMYIKPSGLGYYETEPEDIVVMTLDGEILDSDRTPSSEWALHAAIYKEKEDANSVVHTHQPYCTTFACLRMPIKAVHYLISASGSNAVEVADYATFGTPDLATKTVEGFGDSKAVLMANHGLITYHENINRAFSLARTLEYVAELQWRALSVGEPAWLSKEAIDGVSNRMKTYGQSKK